MTASPAEAVWLRRYMSRREPASEGRLDCQLQLDRLRGADLKWYADGRPVVSWLMSLPRAGRLANVMQRLAAEVGATADEPFVPIFPAVVAPSPAPGPSLPELPRWQP